MHVHALDVQLWDKMTKQQQPRAQAKREREREITKTTKFLIFKNAKPSNFYEEFWVFERKCFGHETRMRYPYPYYV